ncbi:hypothetical protein PoB_004974900 [Plakobranchus ocellatus]|uniref:Uncharacterized protein n=1 Tax=Plakobranchus ocellatus TaxID=259542 RepID=A0AAV4BWS1_9GAST|nr:hypothetical protein PoB_004974900 [Plakobranchus ocellatus]
MVMNRSVCVTVNLAPGVLVVSLSTTDSGVMDWLIHYIGDIELLTPGQTLQFNDKARLNLQRNVLEDSRAGHSERFAVSATSIRGR